MALREGGRYEAELPAPVRVAAVFGSLFAVGLLVWAAAPTSAERRRSAQLRNFGWR